MGNNTRRIAFLLQLILVGIITISITGCESQPGYRTLTVENKLVSYSFDYSTYYEIVGPRSEPDYVRPYTYITLLAPRRVMKLMVPDSNGHDSIKTVSATYVPAAIDIHIFVPTNDTTAQDFIDGWISTVEKEGHSESLVRSSVVVSGIKAEMLDFIRDSGMILAVDKKIEYNRVIYFDYGGYRWSLSANSEEELVEQVKNDFDHIIETFKIIYVNQP
jgi:hypothetical protein